MKFRLATTLLLVVGLALAAVSVSATTTTRPAKAATGTTWPISTYGTPRATDNVILKWDEQLLSTIRAYPPQTGPTITSRALGVLHTATYDAWAAYDPKAKVTRPDGPKQQLSNRNTLANKEKAISYAAYRVLVDLFPPGTFKSTGDFKTPDVLMSSLRLDAAYTTVAGQNDAVADPRAVGNLAAKAVLTYRHADGSNQLNGYADTPPLYTPTNTWEQVKDPWRWQPLCVPLPAEPGGPCNSPAAVQKPLTPQWGRVKMFGLQAAADFWVPGPAKNPDGSFSTADLRVAIDDAANLTDPEKATAEYWADGPKSEFPPGHSALFAQAISRKNNHSLDTDAKMFMLVGNAMMDAGIAAWHQKYRWDTARNVTLIRHFYKDQLINSWRGPNQGWGDVMGQYWRPYQATNVVTPPFPEYVSGHSTFTSAGAEILGMFNGDAFGATVVIPMGSSKFEANTPATDVTLTFPTFSEAAAQAGMSRRYGGIHLQTGDVHGRALGQQVASFVWSQGQNYIRGFIGK